MSIQNGLILYNIERDGCLNGVYTNENSKGVMSNEILQKFEGEANAVTGKYGSSYFEQGQRGAKPATLTISCQKTGIYSFSWADEKGKEVFRGIGYQMNDRQIAVRYVTPEINI